MKKYDTYKDSGIEWLGEIPEHWEISKLNYISDVYGGATPKSNVDNYWGGNINWITPDDLGKIQGKSIVFSRRTITESGLLSCSASVVPKGSIVLSSRAPIGHIGILEVDACTNQGCKAFVPNEKVQNYFLYYYLLSAKTDLQSLGTGSTFLEISTAIIKNYRIALPPYSEQISIVSFLENKTTQIDTLIEKKEHLVEKLTLKRQAIINEAVTKGLNPDVPMKDSGIEWLGEIAESWETKKIKHSCYVKGRIGWKGLKTDDYLDEGYAYLVTGTDFTGQVVDWSRCHYIDKERYDEDPYIQLKNGDVLLTKDGTIGKVTLVDNLNKPASLNSGIFLIRSLINELDTHFLYWVLNSNIFKVYIDLTSTGATIKHLYQNVFVEFEYALPPLKEQLKIEEFLFHINKEFEDTIEKINTSIDKLKLYRQSLISEAVTGKIDLRDWKQTDNK